MQASGSNRCWDQEERNDNTLCTSYGLANHYIQNCQRDWIWVWSGLESSYQHAGITQGRGTYSTVHDDTTSKIQTVGYTGQMTQVPNHINCKEKKGRENIQIKGAFLKKILMGENHIIVSRNMPLRKSCFQNTTSDVWLLQKSEEWLLMGGHK